jgi:hypothetical protein
MIIEKWLMMLARKGWSVAAVILFTVLGTSVVQANIVYSVDISSGTFSLTGSITTDGTTGTLTASDILAWNFSTTPNVHFVTSIDSTTGTSSLTTGTALTATLTELSFNFGDSNPDALIFTNANFGTVGGMKVQFCTTAAMCVNQVPNVLAAEVSIVFVAPGC